MNADVNAALNILKKVAPKFARIGGSGGVSPPVRIGLPVFRKQTPHEAPSLRTGQFTTSIKGVIQVG